MDTVIYLSGTTRGGALEGITRAYAPILRSLDIELVEISLTDPEVFLQRLKTLDFSKVKFILSGVGMGADLALNADGQDILLWKKLGIPFITLHGDSPAYFFDRHIVRDNSVISLYAFAEHCEFRKRLPRLHGPISTLPPIVLDEIPVHALNPQAKRNGTLLFLKNGKDPAHLRRMWAACMTPRPLRALLELADFLDTHLDDPATNQIDDLVTRYFDSCGLDVHTFVKLRLLLVAQLDDYLRAVKCTCMVEALKPFPVHIRGNNWDHVDFTHSRATYIDDCNYVDSISLIRQSLGLIDMSANTASFPHDRVARAYGSRTLCLTNQGQAFLLSLPHPERHTYSFQTGSLQDRVAHLLAHKAEAVDLGIEVAEAFRRIHPPERSFQRMLEYADLARLDQLPQRPPLPQDFVVWPPQIP